MAKKIFEVGEEERKLLEGSDSGKALLKKLEAAAQDAERAMLEKEAKLESAEKARKELEDNLLNPDILEAISSKRRPAAPVEEENLDELPPSKLAAKLRAERKAELEGVKGEMKKNFEDLVTKVAAAFQTLQLDALEDKHGDKFVSRKDKLAEFAALPENRALRPRQVYAKFLDREELEEKRKADAEAAKAEEAHKRELEAFAENPESTIATSAAQSTEKDLSKDEQFEKAWKATPGAEKLLRQD